MQAGLPRLKAGQALLQAPGHQRRRVAAPPAAAARQKQQRQPPKQQQGGKGFGGTTSSTQSEPVQPQQAVVNSAAAPKDVAPQAAPAPSSDDASPQLPAVSKGRIFAACAQVSLLVTVLAFGLRQVAPAIAPAVRDGQADTVDALLNWAALPSPSQLALAAAVAAAVTGARLALLAAWPDFREASERSNSQVLTPLGTADLLWVGGLPAVSEELLFRGALIPAVYPDWRGVLIAGLAFGVLHNSGGRNAAFAAWASLVGCAYGALFLATGSVACPALAHSLANIASAALWKAANSGGSSGAGGSSS